MGLLRWFWYVVIGNPIVVRTVCGGSRRMRHQWVRMGYLGVLIAMVTLGLMTGGGMAGAVSLTELAKAGTWLFAIVGFGQVTLICLLAPLFMAGAISEEQSGKTYDILLTTPLQNLQIVLGALLGRMVFVLLLLAGGLPLFAVLLIFGGVPMEAVFICFAVSALTALLVGSVAVTLSVLRVAGRRVVFVFVISVASYLVGSYLLDLLILRRTTAVPNSTTWLTPVHPLLVVEASMHSGAYRPPEPHMLKEASPLGRWYLAHPFAAFTTWTTLASGFLILFSTLILRRIAQSEGIALGRVGRWLRLGGGADERRHAARHVRGNPIAWREAHTRGNRTGGILARWLFVIIGLGVTVTMLWMYHHGSISGIAFQKTLITLLLVELAMVMLVAIYMSAGSVTAEREDGTLDQLLTTPITPREYIWGKLRGAVRFLVVILSVPILTLAIVSVYTFIGTLGQWPQATINTSVFGRSSAVAAYPLMLLEAPLLLAITVVPFVAVCVVIGLGWSLKSRRVLGAVIPSVAMVAALVAVLGFCGWGAVSSVGAVGIVVNAFSPITSVVVLVDPWALFDEAPGARRGLLAFSALLAGTVYAGVVYAAINSMVRGFDQTVRRISGQS